jgi:DNA replication protein DnaC
VTLLLEMRENRSLQRFHKQLEQLDLLILDELGYVPFAKAGAELLFDVVARAYERSSLIVTTNLSFENWTEVLGSERLTGAMLDWLLKSENAFEVIAREWFEQRKHEWAECSARIKLRGWKGIFSPSSLK